MAGKGEEVMNKIGLEVNMFEKSHETRIMYVPKEMEDQNPLSHAIYW